MANDVALLAASSYTSPDLPRQVFQLLENAGLGSVCGKKVLLKPNLLMAHELACTNPQIMAAVCRWLLDNGASVIVADSPAFGTCEGVAKSIGLTAALRPLGVSPQNFTAGIKFKLPVAEQPLICVAKEAMEADLLVSAAKLKAHSQMCITLTVKNCFGCVLGLHKVLAHMRFGRSVEYFADCVAALWSKLPPVVGFLDGIIAMTGTGPRLGQPCNLGLIGAAGFAPALDAALMRLLQIDEQIVPLACALARLGVDTRANFTLGQPADFALKGFAVPPQLKAISFNPLVFVRSLVRRLWLEWRN